MYLKTFKKGEENFLENILAVAERFKGRGGGPDSESAVNAQKQDLQDGFVTFWSDNSDITNLINRSANYILELNDHEETVSMKIDKKGFRSCCHAFKLSK
jgi:hypothetical protein